MVETKKINSLQGLRFLAFLGIFIFHLRGYFDFPSINYASICVMFFLVLSGFFSEYTISKYMKEENKHQIINYVAMRLRKIYPLYIIMLFLFIPLSVKNLIIEQGMPIGKYICYFVMNIFLLESLSIKYFDSIAYPGWFVSLLFFMFLVTIPFSRFLEKIGKKNVNYILLLGVLLCLEIVYVMLVPLNLLHSLTYVLPIGRFVEYFIGMVTCKIYTKYKDKDKFISPLVCSILEFVLIAIVIINFNLQARAYIIFCVFCVVFLILVFSFQKGYISKILSSKIITMFGNISMEMYLIHNLLTGYVLGILTRVLPHEFCYALGSFIFVFVLTIYLSYLIHYKKYKGWWLKWKKQEKLALYKD